MKSKIEMNIRVVVHLHKSSFFGHCPFFSTIINPLQTTPFISLDCVTMMQIDIYQPMRISLSI